MFSVDNNSTDRFRLIGGSGNLPPGSLSLRRQDWHTMLLVVRNRMATGYFDGSRAGNPAELHAEARLPAVPTIFFGSAIGPGCEVDHFTVWDLSKNVVPAAPVASPVAVPGPSPGPRSQPKWSFAANGSWRYRVVDTEKVTRPNTTISQIQQITAVQTFEITVTVTGVDARGAANLLVTVDRVQSAGDWSPSVRVDINGGTTYVGTFRHDTRGTVTPVEAVKSSAAPLDKLVGATLTMQMLPDGRVLNVKGSPQIQSAQQTQIWLEIGGAPWDAQRLQRSLSSWTVSLPDDKEFKVGRWNRTLPACFWRELPQNLNTFFTLKPPVNGDMNAPVEFDADYRTGPRRTGATGKNENPTGSFVFDAAAGRLKSATRRFSLVRRVSGGDVEMTLTNSVESIE
jgi:hypothetical protein